MMACDLCKACGKLSSFSKKGLEFLRYTLATLCLHGGHACVRGLCLLPATGGGFGGGPVLRLSQQNNRTTTTNRIEIIQEVIR